jgi:hypothetical protein
MPTAVSGLRCCVSLTNVVAVVVVPVGVPLVAAVVVVAAQHSGFIIKGPVTCLHQHQGLHRGGINSLGDRVGMCVAGQQREGRDQVVKW